MFNVNGKRIHIIGLGAKGTGRACARVLSERGALITISDTNSPGALVEEIGKLADTSVCLQLGSREAYRDITQAELIIPSPGVPLGILPLQQAAQAGIPIYSEIEVAYRLSQAPIIAITGTKGKTTTTTLIGMLLDALHVVAFVGGNIGRPLIEISASAQPSDMLVAEVSSFQLEAVHTFRPKVAVFTNLYADHLDRYQNSMQEYLAAKLRLFTCQTSDDFAVVNIDRPEYCQVESATQAKILRVSLEHRVPGGMYLQGDNIISELSDAPEIIMSIKDIRLKGRHNLANALEALAAVAVLGYPIAQVASSVFATFRGVPNRLEEVATVHGVTFYNDSQGTTPVAVSMALQAFSATPPILIAGGRAKVEDFGELGKDIAAGARALIVIGEAADLIAAATRAAAKDFPIHYATSLPDAVQLGYSLAQPDGVVILSPACASFDMFRNMEHRGEVFRQSVALLHE